jgi:hypothetical protein
VTDDWDKHQRTRSVGHATVEDAVKANKAEDDRRMSNKASMDIAAPAKKPKPYEFYKFNGGRGVALMTRKASKVIQHAIRKGDIFGVKPSAKGPDWGVLITKDLGPGIVFAVPQTSLQKILNNSIKWTREQGKGDQPTPGHLLQMRAAWQEASPEGLGDKPGARLWYVLAKFCNIHKGVKVNPLDLLLACEYNEKGLSEDKKALLMKHLRPYLAQLNRGMMATKKLFTARLTKTEALAMARFIQTPKGKPTTRTLELLASHDRKWKADGSHYVSRASGGK